MTAPRVLLMHLSCRTSAKGLEYQSTWNASRDHDLPTGRTGN
jgi:hypothetical protein